MNFNKHSEIKGLHATFSPSQSSWLRYDEEKIAERKRNQYRNSLGTELHEFAAMQIKLCIKQTSTKSISNGITNYIFQKYYQKEIDDASDFAKTLISNLQYLSKEVYETVKEYINDCIGFRMNPEQPLFYSEDFFGTADTISFRNNQLKIFDLKTGDVPAHIDQLMIYAALFCLEYKTKPSDIDEIELRIYQNNEILYHNPTIDEIVPIMDKIITFDKILKLYSRN